MLVYEVSLGTAGLYSSVHFFSLKNYPRGTLKFRVAGKPSFNPNVHVKAKMASVFPPDTAIKAGTKMAVLDLESVVKYKKSNRSSTDKFCMN